MATHVWLNPGRFRRKGRETTVDGVDFVVTLSPSDTPTGIRGQFRPETKEFEISFDYMDSETPGASRSVGGITFVEGKYSGKLLKIRIPVESKPLDKVGLIRLQTKVVDALKGRMESLDPTQDDSRPFGKYLNSQAAADVVASEEEFNSVARELVAS